MFKNTPENIEELPPNHIFVFGSNLNGNHAGGAARKVMDFGAICGQGEGLQGNSYAFPTLDVNMQRLDNECLNIYRNRLYEVCEENSNKQFLLTKVGCGIAGYPEDFIKQIFNNPPKNLILPIGW